jgi:hypothetical protein
MGVSLAYLGRSDDDIEMSDRHLVIGLLLTIAANAPLTYG